jgi:UDP-N-acetylmuramate dehydrogenase
VLVSARVLDPEGHEAIVPAGELGLAYRDSRLKHGRPGTAPELVLEATFQLSPAEPDVIKARLDDIRRWRQAHQPLGLPSAGSVFRNPADDSAGRLIEEAGLKGHRIGGAVVSEKHANFIVNDQKGTAADVRRLGDHVRAVVAQRHGVDLAFEIEFLGDWDGWPWPP